MSDVNYRSYADIKNVCVSREIISPNDWNRYSDILKFSNVLVCFVDRCYINGGTEDCIDINRYCRVLTIEDTDLKPNGRFGITIKGGSWGITLKNVTFHSHGSETDIDIGNWSDQSDSLTSGVTLENVTSIDGNPVRVRVLWGEPPVVIGGNVKVTVYPKWLVKIYRWLRKRNLVT